MSDNEDLFADSDDDNDDNDSEDTKEMIAKNLKNNNDKKTTNSGKKTSSSRPPLKKIAATKPTKATKKDSNNKDGDDDDDDDGKGLFDSDSEDDEEKKETTTNKRSAVQQISTTAGLSKRERLEALAASKRKQTEPESRKPKAKSTGSADTETRKKNDQGYESEESIDSAQFQRTKEDDDFIDTTGEDADAVQELYAEQHFDDEDEAGEERGKKKKKRKVRYGDDEAIEDNGGDAEPDNPIMAAVHRMKKKKKEKRSLTEIEDECRAFLGKMEIAADEDELAIQERRPGLKKLAMLNEVCEMLTKVDMQRLLLDFDLLSICRRWIQPLPNGTLGNVTVRQRLLEVIANMNGENGISAMDLKRSEFGKTVMVLYKHRAETPAMKMQLKKLIEQWSRPIFQKSGDMRDLERVHAHRGQGSIATLARHRHSGDRSEATKANSRKETNQDLDSIIASGKKGGAESGISRVRVPYSKGFNFSVRPQDRMSTPEQGAKSASNDNRGKLSKRILEKSRPVVKNQRSANISVEGRPTK